MKFLLDQHLPISLCGLLRQLGHEALHVEALGLADESDSAIWERARQLDAVMVSKDSDFLVLAERSGCLLRLRVGNCSNRELFAIIERGCPSVVAQLEAGERIVELRA